ncbi:unnamed protein product [Lepeophtheirus salmonis]|uniref:(salmon louse) hypothetical protein n=1 Tax=Lepeophtheirus salmonis TaxID=72036 RepID=A0A0K2ULV1_LEPSM|nr:melatonin receptor type 1A-like isoform X2 [Lepeophtheirus salmonis]XP_040567243.1 melatonin receptor type 1A-like isoform X2 [Lepeophtheirus salmonis]XP_040567244.1 melatonin receptor type 1A-like isoform X2 [Lepeophtheirus salmonis]CAB4063238.1 unnamed protein product [Lepeophtheirus salmonis]CAF2919612.1 unnamed protein product [Lepeophtheirus salmonis]
MESNITQGNDSSILECSQYSQWDESFLDIFSYWTEGVLQTFCAILGIIGNFLAGLILSRKSMKNVFNLLLVTLAIFDSTYLFGSILESFRKSFNLATNTHIILFPHMLYPITQISIAGSIFMTVAIALERYIAVHYPLTYNQAMHESNALPKRIAKYISCVLFLSLLFSFTRFFEAEVRYDPENPLTPYLKPTVLRTNSMYVLYFNWSRLIVLGIIPFMLLVFFNVSIYKAIQARRKRRHKPDVTQMTTTMGEPKEHSASSKKIVNSVREQHVNETRSKKEDNLAVIFMAFILVFLICHLPRLLLNIHELLTITETMECQKRGHFSFSLMSMVSISVSHFLLVVNSSTNIIIYCALSSKFRVECNTVYTSLCRRLTGFY